MDIIQQCLALSAVPGLGPAFSVFRFIWLTIEQVQLCKQQLIALMHSTAQLLETLDAQFRGGQLSEVKNSTPLANLIKLLQEISQFVQAQATQGFLKSIFSKDQRIARIDIYHRRIAASVDSFQISALVGIEEWQERNHNARISDQNMLDDRLHELESNQSRLIEALNVHQTDIMSMMVSLQRRLDDQSFDNARERNFYSYSLQYLSTTSGRQIEVQDWMVTSYEVDFGHEIGSGGFGQVFKGTWNKMPVAVKVLKSNHGVAPSSATIRREITTWSRLRHPHVLQFLGANVLDEKPFIVMPLLRSGNARDYIQIHPTYDRLPLLHHVALGLVYLHSQKVIHGDLKALNILIDDNGKGVLCDFGLSRVKADVTSRTAAADNTGVFGSRNWMSPERLLGGSLKKPCDIYAFAMTLYEIFVDEVPLGDVDHSQFIELVVRNDVRPERPDDEDDEERAPQLTDAVWELAEQCWVKDPKNRPTADTLCDSIVLLLENRDNNLQSPQLLLPRSPGDSPFSLQASSISMPTSPSSSNFPTTSTRPPGEEDTTPIRKPLPFDDTENFRNRNPFAVDASAPLPTKPGEAVMSSKNPFRELMQALTPPDDVEVPSEAVPLSNNTSGTVEVRSEVMPPAVITTSSTSEPHVKRPLPLGWEERKTAGGLSYFVDHINRKTMWMDPRDDERVDQDTPRVDSSPSDDKLPPGWEKRLTADQRPYYVDHNSKITTWVRPRIPVQRLGLPMYENIPTPNTLTRIHKLQGHTDSILCIAVSSDGKLVVTGGLDNTVRIWDADSGEPVGKPLVGHTAFVTSVTISPDDALLASGSADSSTILWDLKINKYVATCVGHTDFVRSVVFSSSGRLVASVSDDKTCRIWDSETATGVIAPLQGHTQAVRSVCFNADATQIATGSSDKTIRVWDVQTGAPICKPLKGLKNSPRMLAFTRDGKRIVAGSKERKFCIWNAESGALISGLTERIGRSVLASLFQPNCQCLTTSPDGLWIATGSLSGNIFKTNDLNVQIWDPDTGKRVGTSIRDNHGVIRCLTFSPDGKRVFIGDFDSNLEVFVME